MKISLQSYTICNKVISKKEHPTTEFGFPEPVEGNGNFIAVRRKGNLFMKYFPDTDIIICWLKGNEKIEEKAMSVKLENIGFFDKDKRLEN
ncbi:hypothetical protein QUF80_24310 [Desulfococcaceae bacterium HSG8]|nr:hypothetical protein [Desulfococcaceae bacterium HSG8]